MITVKDTTFYTFIMQDQKTASETWKDVLGYEGLYSVSSMGNVYNHSLRKAMAVSSGFGGYLKTGLTKGGRRKMWRIHRLVALAFLRREEGRDQVNHINGDKTDNRLVNLEWCTASENVAHAFKSGLGRDNKKDSNSNSKLSQEVADVIKEAYAKGGVFQKELARQYGLHQSTISLIVTGKRWQI